MANDYFRAVSQSAGNFINSGQPTYLSGIKFIFEGQVGIQARYQQVNNPTYSKDGWSHGSDMSDIKQPGNWTASSINSVVAAPVAYFDN